MGVTHVVAGSVPVSEEAVRAIGRRMLQLMRRERRSRSRSRIQSMALGALRDPVAKTQLFRFIDVLPALHEPEQVVAHAREYMAGLNLPPMMRAGLRAAPFAPALAARAIRSQVRELADELVIEDVGAALIHHVQARAAQGIRTTVTLLREAVVSEPEADEALARSRALLDVVAASVGRRPDEPGLPIVSLSVKPSALAADLRTADPRHSVKALGERLRPLLRRAAELHGSITLDMEAYRLKDLTLELFRSLLEEAEFREQPSVGVAIQAYLRDSERDLRDLIGWARAHGRRIAVRLVRGAYWDHEMVFARQRGWPVPVWSRKAETDVCYERLSTLLMQNADAVVPVIASHNVRSCAYAVVAAEALGVERHAYELQLLYGMADDLKGALVQLGYRVREYCPVGDLLPGMSYLVRRLLENTSNESFVRLVSEGSPPDDDRLLESPLETLASQEQAHEGGERGSRSAHADREFRNVPWTDFSRSDSREAFRAALSEVSASVLGRRWPLVIGGRSVVPDRFAPSINPARPAQVVGEWAVARPAHADAAVAAARRAQPSWAARSAEERARIVERVADLMEQRRLQLSALEVFEAGKPWIDADADVAEAIDYCRFYGSEMRRLGAGRVTAVTPGERNVLGWTARGVAAVIAPWNFPLAILCGMTVAALVAGNAVIVKPAEQTSVIGAVFMDLLAEAGVPPGTANLLTGVGEEVGAHLVAHADVDLIAFTGSRAVGLQIWEAAGRTVPGQKNLKKVVCEMGGKNALVIDSDADLDEAIPAALASAFGYSGQKCSALSRIIAVGAIHDELLRRFLPACASVPIGDPAQPDIVIGPVIDAEARDRIMSYIARGIREATLAFQGRVPSQDGFWVPPTVFVDVKPEHVIAREEIFGPVVAVMRARNLDHAIELANSTEYALTAGMFSRLPSSLERASRELKAGNVYLNRGITGALVGRQPFGGVGMSGAGTRAGGTGYLEHFMFSRVVSENQVRRGFSPSTAT